MQKTALLCLLLSTLLLQAQEINNKTQNLEKRVASLEKALSKQKSNKLSTCPLLSSKLNDKQKAHLRR